MFMLKVLPASDSLPLLPDVSREAVVLSVVKVLLLPILKLKTVAGISEEDEVPELVK